MKLRNTLLCGVAATALGLAAALPTNSSILPSLTTPAQAQVQASVSIGFGTFYDSLSPHGDWVRIEGRHVWVPGDVRADWRPYTVGRWVYTRPHGWTWVSDEPYGWAVYHYGRWGFHHTIGWYWVPDTVWAPAWVTWRVSDDYAVWAPMPPQGRVQVTYEVDPFVIPARYWVAVPTAQFLAPSIFSVALHFGEPRFHDVVRYTRPVGHVRVVNNIAINTVINVNFIERETGETVRVREVRHVEDVQQVSVEDDAVALFAPAVEEEPEAEPEQVRTEEEIAEERGVDVAAEPAEEAEDQPIEVAEDAPEPPEEAVAEEAAPATDEDVAEESEVEPESDVAEEPAPEAEPEADVAEETAPEGEPEADVAEEPEAEAEPEADVAEEAEPEADVAEEPAPEAEADVAEEPEAEGEPEADVAEEPEAEAPAVAEEPETEAPAVAEEPEPEAPAVAEEPEPEAPAVAEEPTQPAPEVAEEPEPQVEERAIGEPSEEETEEERRRRLGIE